MYWLTRKFRLVLATTSLHLISDCVELIDRSNPSIDLIFFPPGVSSILRRNLGFNRNRHAIQTQKVVAGRTGKKTVGGGGGICNGKLGTNERTRNYFSAVIGESDLLSITRSVVELGKVARGRFHLVFFPFFLGLPSLRTITVSYVDPFIFSSPSSSRGLIAKVV